MEREWIGRKALLSSNCSVDATKRTLGKGTFQKLVLVPDTSQGFP